MRRRRWAGLLFLPVVGAPLSTLAGQEVHLGSRIRVTAPTLGLQKSVGMFQGLIADSLRLDSLVVPLRSISRLEFSRGQSTAIGQGAGMGAAGGLLLGVAIGASACEEGLLSEGGCVFLAGMGGAVGGMMLGAMMGALVKQEHWSTLRLEPLIAGSGFIPGFGLALGISLR